MFIRSNQHLREERGLHRVCACSSHILSVRKPVRIRQFIGSQFPQCSLVCIQADGIHIHYTAIPEYFGRGLAFADDLFDLLLRRRIQDPAFFASHFCAVAEIQFFVLILAYAEQRNAVITPKHFIDNKFFSNNSLKFSPSNKGSPCKLISAPVLLLHAGTNLWLRFFGFICAKDARIRGSEPIGVRFLFLCLPMPSPSQENVPTVFF